MSDRFKVKCQPSGTTSVLSSFYRPLRNQQVGDHISPLRNQQVGNHIGVSCTCHRLRDVTVKVVPTGVDTGSKAVAVHRQIAVVVISTWQQHKHTDMRQQSSSAPGNNTNTPTRGSSRHQQLETTQTHRHVAAFVKGAQFHNCALDAWQSIQWSRPQSVMVVTDMVWSQVHVH